MDDMGVNAGEAKGLYFVWKPLIDAAGINASAAQLALFMKDAERESYSYKGGTGKLKGTGTFGRNPGFASPSQDHAIH